MAASAVVELKPYGPLLADAIARAPAALKAEGEQLRQAASFITFGADSLYLFFRREEIQRFVTAWLVPQIRAYAAKVDGKPVSAIASLTPGLSQLLGTVYDEIR